MLLGENSLSSHLFLVTSSGSYERAAAPGRNPRRCQPPSDYSAARWSFRWRDKSFHWRDACVVSGAATGQRSIKNVKRIFRDVVGGFSPRLSFGSSVGFAIPERGLKPATTYSYRFRLQ